LAVFIIVIENPVKFDWHEEHQTEACIHVFIVVDWSDITDNR